VEKRRDLYQAEVLLNDHTWKREARDLFLQGGDCLHPISRQRLTEIDLQSLMAKRQFSSLQAIFRPLVELLFL